MVLSIEFNRFRFHFILLTVALMTGLLLVGCLPGEPKNNDAEEPENGIERQVNYPVTITDDAGREVVIEEIPERLVSFAPSNTEILFALDVGSSVVGVDDFSIWPEGKLQGLVRIGGPESPDYEVISELEPDIVFCVEGMDEIAQQLDDMGLTSIILKADDFSDVYANVALIGNVVNKKDKAEAVVDYMKEETNKLENKVTEIPENEKPRVFVEIWPSDPIITAGKGTLVHQVIESAGGINAAGEHDVNWPSVSVEELVELEPDVLILQFKDSYQSLKSSDRPEWNQIPAVQNERYYLVSPGILNHPSPRLVEGIKTVAEILHPELFE